MADLHIDLKDQDPVALAAERDALKGDVDPLLCPPLCGQPKVTDVYQLLDSADRAHAAMCRSLEMTSTLVGDMAAAIRELRAERDAAVARVADLEAEVEELLAWVADLEADVDRLRQERNDLAISQHLTTLAVRNVTYHAEGYSAGWMAAIEAAR